MNIFILDEDPVKAANLLDKHIVKMPLETAQILCTVAQKKGFQAIYKITHAKHPVTLWTEKSSANWNWLCEHGIAICHNYSLSYKKIHKCEEIIKQLQSRTLEIWGDSIPSIHHTPFVTCMPEQYKTQNPIESYRNYYHGDKVKFAKWTNRVPPEWWSP